MTVLDAIRDGSADIQWSIVECHASDGTRVSLVVFSDALKVNGVRVSVTAEEAQQAADLLQCSLTTPRIEDLIFENAGAVAPPVVNWESADKWNTNSSRSKITASWNDPDYSHAVDSELAGAGAADGDLVATVGKSWCVGNALADKRIIDGGAEALNYGWVHPSAAYPAVTAGLKCWQQPGTRHNLWHKDPSQNLRLVSVYCVVGVKAARLEDVLQDPVLSTAISHEGVLRVLRQPGVEELEPIQALPQAAHPVSVVNAMIRRDTEAPSGSS